MTLWQTFKTIFAKPEAKAPPKKLTGAEQRLAIRKRQRLMEGFLWSDRMAYSKACTIRDISVTGARVDLMISGIKTHTLVGPLTLYFATDKREIDCQLMWRAGRSVGLRFIGPYRPPTRRYGGR